MNKIIAGAAVVLGLGIAAFWYTSSSGTQATNALYCPLFRARKRNRYIGRYGNNDGRSNASITVIEYASYTCPHCARFMKTSLRI